jgi:hypothetical protein
MFTASPAAGLSALALFSPAALFAESASGVA